MGIAGTSMQANAASQRKSALRRIAETPGLDVGASTTEAKNLASGTQELERQRNQFNAAELQKMLETSIPGYAAGQKLRVQNATDFLRGEIPVDVQQQIQRSTTARALEGGYGGSGMGRNLTARDLGLTSVDLMGRGAQQFAGIIGSTPMASLANYTWSPQQIAALREQERRDRMAASFAAEQAIGGSELWGRQLQQVGDKIGMSAIGGGAAGGGGGGGGGGISKSLLGG